MSNFVKSSNSIVSFCGAVTLFSCSFAILVAANFSTCASISLSSILENNNSALFIWCVAVNKTVFSVTSSQDKFASRFKIFFNFVALKGKKGSETTANAAEI